MELFLRGAAAVLVGVILTLVVSRQRPDFGILLSVGICCCICMGAAEYLGAIVDLLGEIRVMADLDHQLLSVLLKCAGIGLIGELSGLICADAGMSSMAKALQILSNAAVLYLSIPMLRQLLSLLEEVLGKV